MLTCLSPCYALAQVAEDLPSDSRIKMLMYDETDVYTLNTRYGYQTNVVFGPEEEIQTISVGDRSLWQIIPAGNRLFIRPLEEDSTTNMTIITSRHSYQFDLKSAGPDNKEATIVYVAKFVYPAKKKPVADAMMMAPPPAHVETAPPPVVLSQEGTTTPPAPVAVAPTPAPVAAAPESQPPLKMNYSYTYSGADLLAPLQVYDDGRSTYIKFRDVSQALPNPFVVDARRNEHPVNYTVKDDMMVIDRVVGELELKNSAGTVNIYNELLNPR